jgi:F-type H+-transporting ATPase subunit b
MNSKMSSAGRFLRTRFLWLLALSVLSPVLGSRAQDQTAPASQAHPQSSQNQNSKAQDSANQDSSRPPGFARQLATETREAAGEESGDDKKKFKQSASIQFISKKLGISPETTSLLSFLINFAVIAGIFIWAGGKFLPKAFRDRTAAIQKAMREAQKAGEEARLKLAEIETRLVKLDAEIGGMRESAEKEAAAEEARIQAATQEDARKMVEAAHQEIDAAAKAARRALTAYAADLAVGLAQKQIHVDAGTDENLVRNFSGQLLPAPDSAVPGDVRGKGRN